MAFDHICRMIGHAALETAGSRAEKFSPLRIGGLLIDSAQLKSFAVDPDHVAVHSRQHHRMVGRNGIQFLSGRIGWIVPDFVVPSHSAHDPFSGLGAGCFFFYGLKNVFLGAVTDG